MDPQATAKILVDAFLPTIELELNRLAAEGVDPRTGAFVILHASAGKVLESLGGTFLEAKRVAEGTDGALVLRGSRADVVEHFKSASRVPGFPPDAGSDKLVVFVQVENHAFMYPLDFTADAPSDNVVPS